jgi:hypothetical protein
LKTKLKTTINNQKKMNDERPSPDLLGLSKPLSTGQIEFKVSQVRETDNAVWASILAYKDARTDMQVLDDTIGPMNWQVKYERDSKGVLQCAIGIFDPAKGGFGEWVWKTSNGVESDFESEKGEYSDAFKRAGFMWGIGRQLYDFPSIWVQMADGDYYSGKDGKAKASPRFRPNEWRWTVSEDYQEVKAERKFGNTWKIIFNTNPYKKDE